jgi:hypothetical protein
LSLTSRPSPSVMVKGPWVGCAQALNRTPARIRIKKSEKVFFIYTSFQLIAK